MHERFCIVTFYYPVCIFCFSLLKVDIVPLSGKLSFREKPRRRYYSLSFCMWSFYLNCLNCTHNLDHHFVYLFVWSSLCVFSTSILGIAIDNGWKMAFFQQGVPFFCKLTSKMRSISHSYGNINTKWFPNNIVCLVYLNKMGSNMNNWLAGYNSRILSMASNLSLIQFHMHTCTFYSVDEPWVIVRDYQKRDRKR